jgi:hypothetical protein
MVTPEPPEEGLISRIAEREIATQVALVDLARATMRGLSALQRTLPPEEPTYFEVRDSIVAIAKIVHGVGGQP